jgi:hypothetical protein
MMVSTLRATKLYFEKLFADNWTQTPIHFAGQEFRPSSEGEWVNVVYTPLSGRPLSLSKEPAISTGILTVICWAESDANAMALADDIIAFVSLNAGAYKMNNYEVTDHVWHDANQVYLYLTFTVESYDGQCVP